MIPPYRTPNQALTTVSELAAIEGMDRATFKVLEPHVTALPGRTKINVNTATAPVLLSLGEDMSTADVEGLLAEREGAGFADIESSFAPLVTPDVINNMLDDETQHFQLKVVVQIDTVRVTMSTVLQRGQQGNVTPILRSLGTT
jgi:general secretion pathway protein K